LEPSEASPADRVTGPGQKFLDETASLVSFALVARQIRLHESAEEAEDVFAPALGAFSPTLLQMIFTRAVDGFDVYLGRLLGLIFVTCPETMKSGEHVAVKDVLEHTTIEELVSFLAARRVERLSRDGLKDVVDDVTKTTGFQLFHASAFEEARRIFEARHLIVHNRGVVDRAYLRRVPDGGTLGDDLEVGADFVIESLAFLVESRMDIDARAITKFDLPWAVVEAPSRAVDATLRGKRWPAIPDSVVDPERTGLQD
jgi:hypothetical protein